MSLSEIFWGIGELLESTFVLLQQDMIGDMFNYAVIALGFVGLFYWLNWQRKFNEQAKNDPNQLK
ncbi:MAG: hypothetical protein EP333_04970 [Bacteroidetes bacterium]|nr:MAG: hypothetical protein EP333_04970 [Bacteroidota bacterium]